MSLNNDSLLKFYIKLANYESDMGTQVSVKKPVSKRGGSRPLECRADGQRRLSNGFWVRLNPKNYKVLFIRNTCRN